jgi:hypothetical protein
MSDVTAEPVVDLDVFAGEESAMGPAGLDAVDERPSRAGCG